MTEYFGFKEAMQYLGIKSHNTLNYYIQQGLPVTQVGKSKRISKTAIDDFMKDHTVASASHHQEGVLTMNDEIKLHQALYEMNRIAEQLFVSYGLLSKIIENVPEDDPSDPMSTKKMLQHLTNELADYSTDLTDNAKAIKEY